VIGIYGGAFDPPHNGHVALVRAAKKELGLAQVVIAVSAVPEHKRIEGPVDVRLRLARAAFPDDEVMLDEHARTVDLLRDHPEWHDPVLLIGADELADFRSWKEPDEVLRLARLAVAARPGYPRERLQAVLDQLEQPERVLFFELDVPLASRELRARFDPAAVPPAVADVVEHEGLYGQVPGYTERA
jgi:nicotinate-nucleotide adenylyltransferase